MPVTDPAFYAIAVPVVLLSGVSKTAIPGLFGGMAVPFLSLVGPAVAGGRGHAPDPMPHRPLRPTRIPRGLRSAQHAVLTGLAIGIIVGMLVFTVAPRNFMRILVGTIAVAFALNSMLGWARHRPPAMASWPRGVFWSALSGLTSFVAHAGSAPIMAYLLPQRLDRRVYVGTTVWFFFASNYAKLMPYAYLGQLDLSNLATALVLLPLVPVGVKLGVVIQGKLDDELYYRISYWALLGIGLKLLYDAASAMWR